MSSWDAVLQVRDYIETFDHNSQILYRGEPGS